MCMHNAQQQTDKQSDEIVWTTFSGHIRTFIFYFIFPVRRFIAFRRSFFVVVVESLSFPLIWGFCLRSISGEPMYTMYLMDRSYGVAADDFPWPFQTFFKCRNPLRGFSFVNSSSSHFFRVEIFRFSYQQRGTSWEKGCFPYIQYTYTPTHAALHPMSTTDRRLVHLCLSA